MERKFKYKLKENLNTKYQVIFWDINYEETPVKQLFNSEKEAQDWAYNKEWDEDYYAYDEERGGDYIEHRRRYFNPEDKENYYGFEIKPTNPIEEILTEEYLKKSEDLLNRFKENNKKGKEALNDLIKNGFKK